MPEALLRAINYRWQASWIEKNSELVLKPEKGCVIIQALKEGHKNQRTQVHIVHKYTGIEKHMVFCVPLCTLCNLVHSR